MNLIQKKILIHFIGGILLCKQTFSFIILTFATLFIVVTNASDNAVDAANRLGALGIIVDNSANPMAYNFESSITRREMLKVMMNLSSVEVTDTCEGKFSDLPSTDWGCKYAEAALKAGFIAANPKFRPNDLVTETEALKMIMQAKNIAKTEGVEPWSQAYLQGAIDARILQEGSIVSDIDAKRSMVFLSADSAITATTEATEETGTGEDLGGLDDLFGGLLDDDGTGTTAMGTNTGTNIRVIGECGSANSQSFSSKPTSNLCSAGTASNPSEETLHWKWTCYGTQGGDSICSAKKIMDGVCGTSNGQTLVSKPTNELCSVGKASSVSGTGPWTWTCSGNNSGVEAKCTSYIISQRQDGVCGISNGQFFEEKPISNLCNAGIESSISGTGPWTWSCNGKNGGSSVTCNTVQNLQRIDGKCGKSDGQIFAFKPIFDLCSAGIASSVSGTGPWSWNCKGEGGGKDDSCEASLIVDGNCGTSNGQTLESKPTSGLCGNGSPSNVSGTGPWIWTCNGSNGGKSTNCNAIINRPIVNGVCGTSNGEFFSEKPSTNLCSSGSPSSVSVNGGTWNWSCKGQEGGVNTPCSAFLPKQKINGTCGATNGYVLTSKPTSNLCTTGTSSSVTGTGPWTWTCSGIDGGSSASCGTLEKSQPIDGICGPASSGSYLTAPIELCTMGIPSVLTQTSTSWRWVCQGLNWGQSKPCSASRLQVIDGKCGISHENSFERSPTKDFCLTGSIKNFSGNGPWYWECGGINGGSKDNCYALKKINGVCGSASGQSLKMIPIENQCASGNETKVNGSGPWNWQCKGENGGLDVSCSAKKIIYGVCGISNTQSFKDKPTINYCSGGTVSVINGTGPWNWECKGENGGSSQKCTALKKSLWENITTTVSEFFDGPKPKTDSTQVDNVSMLEIIVLIIIIVIFLYGGLAVLSHLSIIKQKLFLGDTDETEIWRKIREKVKELLDQEIKSAPQSKIDSDEIMLKVKTLVVNESKLISQSEVDVDILWGKFEEKVIKLINEEKELKQQEEQNRIDETHNKIQEIMNKTEIIRKASKKEYEGSIKKIYDSLSQGKWEVSIRKLYNFLITLRSTNFVMLYTFKPGVGKTNFVKSLVKSIHGENERKYYKYVQIKAESTEESVLCYFDDISYELKDDNGLLFHITQAYNDPNNPYFVLFDEMNVVDMEKYFPWIIPWGDIRKEGCSEFKKLFDISIHDDQKIINKKIAYIDQFNLIVQNIHKDSYKVGYKVPSNLFIIGAANKETNVKSFHTKIIDRGDVILYTRTKSSEQEIQEFEKMTIDFTTKIDWRNLEVSVETKDFYRNLKRVWDFESRIKETIEVYLFLYARPDKYTNIIWQKILPQVKSETDIERLCKLYEFCVINGEKYSFENDLIERIEKMKNSSYPNFWKEY